MHTKIDDRCVRFKVTHGLNGYHRPLVYAFTVNLPGMSVFFFSRFVCFQKDLQLKDCMQKGCLKRLEPSCFQNIPLGNFVATNPPGMSP